MSIFKLAIQYIYSQSYSEEIESLTMEDSFSPLLHRLDQAVRWRAIHPTEPIPPMSEVLQKLSHQPEDLQAKSQKCLEKLIAAADVKKGTFVSGFLRVALM